MGLAGEGAGGRVEGKKGILSRSGVEGSTGAALGTETETDSGTGIWRSTGLAAEGWAGGKIKKQGWIKTVRNGRNGNTEGKNLTWWDKEILQVDGAHNL
jgi:hypothetical protein